MMNRFLNVKVLIGFAVALAIGTILVIWLVVKNPAPVNKLETLVHLEDHGFAQKRIELIADDSVPVIYEGLPHPYFNQGALERERREHRTVSRGNYYFYAKPVAMAPADVNTLIQLVRQPGFFLEWRGMKMCGGFHPDFSVVWKCQDGDLEIQFCFGCDEAKLFYAGTVLRCDLGKDIGVLQTLLRKYHNHSGPQEF